MMMPTGESPTHLIKLFVKSPNISTVILLLSTSEIFKFK